MGRLLAIFAGLLAVLLVPLALGGPTTLLLLPAHLGLSLVVSTGAALDGLDGHAERARRWGFFYLLATLAMVVALEVGAGVRGKSLGYWGVSWAVMLLWGWAPPVISGFSGMVGAARGRRLVRSTVRRRRKEPAIS